jgi:hypothetical protein
MVVLKKSGIKMLVVEVRNNGQSVDRQEVPVVKDLTETQYLVSQTLKVASGTNNIFVFDGSSMTRQASVDLVCSGECGEKESATASLEKLKKKKQQQKKKISVADVVQEIKDGVITPEVTLTDSQIKGVFLAVVNGGKSIEQPQSLIPVAKYKEGKGPFKPPIKVEEGTNQITIYDPTSPEKATTVTLKCKSGKCETTEKAENDSAEEDDDSDSPITVITPSNGDDPNSSFIDAYLKIDKASGIRNIKYRLENGDKVYGSKDKVEVRSDGPTRVRVRILQGENIIKFVDADDTANLEHEAVVKVNCKGEKCVNDFEISKFPSNSLNSRIVVGLEQAGASSASSEVKPFIDLFFSTPFFFTRCPKLSDNASDEQRREKAACEATRKPRLGPWGQVRLASTPDQIAAASVFPFNFVNTLGKSGQSVDLVQSFDFLAGLEYRVKTSNGKFLSLIPGINQRTEFYIAGGGGAINPLTAREELAQIFKIPPVNGSQRADFVTRYGEPPAGKEFVGLVPLDRDRFLRQWYVGLRLKTMYCDDSDCTRYRNNFPAMVDFMIGQNEAVTGGNLKYTVVDPNDPTKTREKRSYVIRFDAFYPFPVREANFLYFYGSAVMKVGAGGVRIQNPLFLDQAAGDVLIGDPRVYIPPSDLQRLFQPSRDYYKIGVGVNLTDLFNRNKETP